MAIKNHKPTSPGRRFVTNLDFAEVTTSTPEKKLTQADLSVSLSIGISAFPTHGATPKELVGRADEALYKSKAAGRNHVSIAEP